MNGLVDFPAVMIALSCGTLAIVWTRRGSPFFRWSLTIAQLCYVVGIALEVVAKRDALSFASDVAGMLISLFGVLSSAFRREQFFVDLMRPIRERYRTGPHEHLEP